MAIKMDGHTITALKLKASDGSEVTKQLTEEGTIPTPTETLNINTNGERDVTNYKKVNVQVEGGELPELTNPALASDILTGKEAIDENGAKLTGTCTFDADTSDADATAADIAKDKTAYVNGQKVVGTHEEAAGGLVPFDSYEFTIAEDYTTETLSTITTIETINYHQAMFDKVKHGTGYKGNPSTIDQRTKILAVINSGLTNKENGRYDYTTQVADVFQNNSNEIKAEESSNPTFYGVVVFGAQRTGFADEGQSSSSKIGLWLKSGSGTSFLVRGRCGGTGSLTKIAAGTYTIKFYDISSAV